MTEQSETVIITRKEYEYLRQSEQILNALETFGVDNWDGYGDALQSLEDDA